MNWSERQKVFMLIGEQTTGEYNLQQAQRYAGHIEEEAKEFSESWDVWYYDGQESEDTLVKAVDGAGDLIVVAMGFMYSLGLSPDYVMNVIQSANDRKMVDCQVYRRPDGQIGKPPGWYGPEAELRTLVNGVLSGDYSKDGEL